MSIITIIQVVLTLLSNLNISHLIKNHIVYKRHIKFMSELNMSCAKADIRK